MWRQGFRQVRLLLEMIRFSHTLFALPFALLAALLAWNARAGAEPFRFRELAGVVLAMATARSTAMAFNRLADRRLDARNPRTAARHLPAGLLSATGVAAFTSLSAAAFVASTLLFLPRRGPLLLSIPLLVFLWGYSYAKRFTSLAHVWLGAALGLAPLAAWFAILGDVSPAPLWLAAAVLLWVAGFDLIYACQDADFDRQAGLHSLPARWGVATALRAAAVCHAGMVVALAALPTAYPDLGGVFYAGVAAVAALLVYEHSLVRPDDLSRVNVAFFNVNIAVSLGLLAVGAVDLWLGP